MKKVKPYFPWKDPNLHPLCKIYEAICSCGETCTGETSCNVEECCSEHNSADNKSEQAKNFPGSEKLLFMEYLTCCSKRWQNL